MKHLRPLLLVLLTILIAQPTGAQTTPTRDLDAANAAWDRGDYITALGIYARLLESPQAADVLEPIALQTGELYRTREITTDGRAITLSADGRLLAYESGPSDRPTLRIVSVDGGGTPIELRGGTGALFSPVGGRLLYLRVMETPQLAQARI